MAKKKSLEKDASSSTGTSGKVTKKKSVKVKTQEVKETVLKIEVKKSQHYDGPGTTVAKAAPKTSLSGKEWNWKLVSWNINGLRAWLKNNGQVYVTEEDPDVICFQEIKCPEGKIPPEANKIISDGHWSPADKDGYAGTGVISRHKPLHVTHGMNKGPQFDQEGRVITVEFEKFYLVNAYVPNSGRGLPRLPYRQKEWDPTFISYLQHLDKKKPLIVCGDLNVAHEDIDLANPATNHKTAGFTNEERAGFTELLRSVDLVDTFRHLYPDKKAAYTFWSYMGNARSKNVGWRLDYFLISKRLLPHLCDHELRSEVQGSDHCPIVLYMHF